MSSARSTRIATTRRKKCLRSDGLLKRKFHQSKTHRHFTVIEVSHETTHIFRLEVTDRQGNNVVSSGSFVCIVGIQLPEEIISQNDEVLALTWRPIAATSVVSSNIYRNYAIKYHCVYRCVQQHRKPHTSQLTSQNDDRLRYMKPYSDSGDFSRWLHISEKTTTNKHQKANQKGTEIN